MLSQITHIKVYVELRCSFVYICLDFSDELFVDVFKLDQVSNGIGQLVLRFYQLGLGDFLLDLFLVFNVFLADMMEKMPEELVVIYNQLVYYSSMNVLTGELVLVTLLDDLGHVCEVLRDGDCIRLNYKLVVEYYIL